MFEIRGNKLSFQGMELELYLPYEDVSRRLENFIYIKSGLDSDQEGFIILKDTGFYGLQGKCTMYFYEGILKILTFEPEWNRYNFNNENGEKLHIDQAIEKISDECVSTLKLFFGEPAETDKYGKNIFKVGSAFTIITSVSSGNDNFSIIVR